MFIQNCVFQLCLVSSPYINGPTRNLTLTIFLMALAVAEFEKLVVTLGHGMVVTHFNVAASCLFVYDFLLNIDLEYQFIWKAPWSIFKILFLLQRYLPFFDTVVLDQYFIGYSTSFRPCITLYRITTWCSITGIFLSEIVLGFRLWAIWGGRKPFMAGLILFFLACWVPSFVFFGRFIRGVSYVSNKGMLSHHHGCLFSTQNNLIFMLWVLLMVYDTGAFIMMAIPGIQAYRMGGYSTLLKAVYQEGLIYYGLIFVVSIMNVVLISTLPRDFATLLAAFERILHSILASRSILHIREVASDTGHELPNSTVSQLSFTTMGDKSWGYR
ncbi:hypothetical protein L218DRAFT_904922 [Marasmius fiardii PR-910]|nr:hypothetical protein L218DRAFT_904922 [Marasmius fiardii PR-910]